MAAALNVTLRYNSQMEDRRNEAVSERIARLRIELQELEPKIWRRIDMPLSTTLEALHEAIQMTMGWTFSHLWEFDIDGRCYGDPSFREFDDEPPIYKAKGLRLGVVISRGVERFVYTYDYGDNWRHDVIVEEVRDGDPDREYPAFVDGARRCPPEDVGGPDGFMDFLEAVLDPAHEQHRDMIRWYGGPFDPIGFDEERARFCMENMVRRRRGPLASHRSGSRRRPDGFMDFLEAVLDPAHEQHRDMIRWYGGPFDPIGFDEERARFCMENMVRRRRGPLASHRSGSRRRKR